MRPRSGGPWLGLFLLVAGCAGGCPGCSGAPSTPDAGRQPPTVRLGEGSFAGPGVIEGDVIYQGAGVGLTRMQAPADAPLLEVPAGVRVVLRDLSLVGSPGQHTVVVQGSLLAERIEVEGGRAAFRIESGDAELRQLTVHDAEAAVRLIAGTALVEDAVAERISSAAYFVAGGLLTGNRLQVRSAETGLLTRPDGRFVIDDLDIRDVRESGIGLVGGAGSLKSVVLEGPMPAGGILANDLLVPAVIEDLQIRNLASVGVSALRSELRLTRATIDTVAADSGGALGMGLFAQSVELTLESVTVRQAFGGGLQLLSTTGSADGLTLEDCGSHGIEAWDATSLSIRQAAFARNAGAGLWARGGASLTVSAGDLRTNTLGPASADCATGSEVLLAAGVQAEEPLGACVSRY